MAGETVITIGFPNGYLSYRYLDNPVLSIGKFLDLDENRFRANLRSEEGCSGSPLMTTEGKVIGILLEGLETNNETVTYVRGRKDYRGQVISRGTPLTNIFS
jgi:V8-like Glu-specific endopeptidase